MPKKRPYYLLNGILPDKKARQLISHKGRYGNEAPEYNYAS